MTAAAATASGGPPPPDDGFDLVTHFDWLLAQLGRPASPPAAPFAHGGSADVLPPGPVLASLTESALARADSLSDDELTGVLQAGRRLANRADYQVTVAIAEIARRRQAQYEQAVAAGRPAGRRHGEFPGEELAQELVDTPAYAGMRIDTALELTGRLPRTLAGMADGTIDLTRALIIARRTQLLPAADAVRADAILAAAAPDKRPDQLDRQAAALELKLAPDAVRARKERARRQDQRVEVRREASGNASVSARELDTADALASKAHIDAVAAKLRASGLIPGTLGQLRALVFTDLTQGRRPLDRLTSAPAPDTAPVLDLTALDPTAPDPTAAPVATAENDGQPGDPPPLPALINLIVPAATLLGEGTTPSTVGGWGLLDPAETRRLVRAASRHPRTRWCVTVTGADGTARAHGCAPGRHPWPESGPSPGTGPPPSTSPPPGIRPLPGAQPEAPTARASHQLRDLLRRLNLVLEPIARDACDHAHAEPRYVPSRKLRHLLRARHQTCTAPACGAQAVYCDNDHTIPYPGGPTCECNLNPKCRRHHRMKQAPGWTVTQPAPDTVTWSTPAGRTRTTAATVYDV